MLLYAFSNFHATQARRPPDVYSRGSGGGLRRAGLQALGGYPLIMRAMLNDDERVWLYMGAFDPPHFSALEGTRTTAGWNTVKTLVFFPGSGLPDDLVR